METLLPKVLQWYTAILLSSEIKLQGGLKNNTMHRSMPVRRSLDCQQWIHNFPNLSSYKTSRSQECIVRFFSVPVLDVSMFG